MTTEDLENKTSYFFSSNLKEILKNSDQRPLFGVAAEEPEKDIKTFSSKSNFDVHEESKTDTDFKNYKHKKDKGVIESFKNHPGNIEINTGSWRDSFFFASHDKRFKDEVTFFSSSYNHESPQFNEVRKKLKQCIRHKISKRKNVIMKKKFYKRKLNRHANRKKM